MSVLQATHVSWESMPLERMNERLERRFLTGQHVTLAQVFLARGCLVPRHEHENEQFTLVTKGCLRLRLGSDGAESVDVRAGEVLLIPPHLPHDAEAIEDTIVIDVFSPIRRDWLERRDDYLRR